MALLDESANGVFIIAATPFSDNGKIAWDTDTKADYQTVNGVAAKGGSVDGGGAVVVDGMVYVSSGSGFAGSVPGNVLLAYSVDGL